MDQMVCFLIFATVIDYIHVTALLHSSVSFLTLAGCKDWCHSLARTSGDKVKFFPPCVELLGKIWALRFKYRVQIYQSSVLDVTEDEDIIQTITSTISLQMVPPKLMGTTITYQFVAAFHTDRVLSMDALSYVGASTQNMTVLANDAHPLVWKLTYMMLKRATMCC
ncbi:hypothetical protein JHK87_000812 [Glycine soja]|nr:hypothetical protein JHK87_000812 [Glycine soja]